MSDSAPKWTPEQEQAIAARGAGILVAAAAGSGKTATLVERVIRRLTDPTDPVDVDQLLVVTFTEAAAAEMRERIAAALQDALSKDPENVRLQRQLALLGRASISTLHSFCMWLIRQYFYRLGLDPAVRVLNEHEALLMRYEVLDDLFARRFEQDTDGAFTALVDRYGGGRDDEGLRRLVLSVYDYVQSLPWPEAWLQEALDRFSVPDGARIDELPWWPVLEKQIHLRLIRAAEALEEAIRLTRLPGGPAPYEETLMVEAAQIRRALEAGGFAELAGAVQAVAFLKLPAVKKDQVDKALQDRVKKLRDGAKKTVRELEEAYFARSTGDWLADLRALAPHMKALVQVVSEFRDAFREAKAAQSAVDFNDLERFALRLLLAPESEPGRLIPSDVARELRARFAEVLVDEYQDINGVQDAILTLVARDGTDGAPNRFMVGDVKQSIYRFRHADPSLFLAKYQAYRPWTGRPQPPAGGRIVLGANFRSRVGVVDAVNFLFRQIMTPGAGELEYDADAELRYRAGYPPLPGHGGEEESGGPPVEVHLLDRKEEDAVGTGTDEGAPAAAEEPADAEAVDSAAEDLAELTAVEREARLVGRRIRELVDGTAETPPLMVWDKKAKRYRRVQYRDIVILMRATVGRVNTYLEVLSQMGIPAHGQTSTGYFAATEVEVVLSLLQILDNPRQDIPLAAVLRSPIVGLSNADLARIRLASPTGSFYEAVQAAASRRDALAEAAAAGEGGRPASGEPLTGSEEADLSQVLANFLAALERWRTLARRRPLSQVLWQIYQETGYLHYVAGMPGGAQREANLLALYERAREFDQFARQGLFRFLRFIERLQEEKGDMGTALAAGEAEDVVRIMSIHKSKGLEFPVVFVVSLGSEFSTRDLSEDVLLDRKLGFGPMVVDPDQRIKYPSLAYHAVRESARQAGLAEEMRVLYVALTRARERLILVGSLADLAARCGQWGTAVSREGWPLPDYLLLSAKSYLDWIGPALMRHADGAPLRECAGAGDPADARVAADRSRWQIVLWDAAAQQALLGLTDAAGAEAVDWVRIGQAEPLDRPYDDTLGKALMQRFRWRYPYEPVVRRFGKLSVTELKGHFDPDSSDLPPERLPRRRKTELQRLPRFLQEGRTGLTPTERGTVVHLVLQHLDLTRSLDEADVAAQVESLVKGQMLTPEQAAAVDAAAIARFFASPLGQRIRRQPDKVRREFSFTLAVPAAEVYTDLPPEVAEGERVIVQGMIDLLLEEPDGFVLVDYKTDRRDPDEAAQRYGIQVALYRRAVEEILGRPVKEAYLHFLAADRSVPVLTLS